MSKRLYSLSLEKVKMGETWLIQWLHMQSNDSHLTANEASCRIQV